MYEDKIIIESTLPEDLEVPPNNITKLIVQEKIVIPVEVTIFNCSSEDGNFLTTDLA